MIIDEFYQVAEEDFGKAHMIGFCSDANLM